MPTYYIGVTPYDYVKPVPPRLTQARPVSKTVKNLFHKCWQVRLNKSKSLTDISSAGVNAFFIVNDLKS